MSLGFVLETRGPLRKISFYITKTGDTFIETSALGGGAICTGDSGGGASVARLHDLVFIIGIQSHGHLAEGPECGPSSVFVNTTTYLGWIESIAFENF